MPGAQVSCACVSGAQGAQVCKTDGTGYEPCQCPDAGAGGAAGAAGTGGTASGLGTCTDPLEIVVPVGIVTPPTDYTSGSRKISDVSHPGAFPTACSASTGAVDVIGLFTAPMAGTWSITGATAPESGPNGGLVGVTCPPGSPDTGACLSPGTGVGGVLQLSKGDTAYFRLDVPATFDGTVRLAAHFVSP